MGGRQDAGFGTVLIGSPQGHFKPLTINESGFFVEGQARKIREIEINQQNGYLFVARNNDHPLIYQLHSPDK